ncbi:MAG: sn-glycerol-3-phosphate ABC transporter ATP-binding protein UgpC [Myxococcota bacterium]|nr:sn-glycerol-3-phosphate ABC transporter ATP-binding protein UgpC [Myxococcota bacterium]
MSSVTLQNIHKTYDGEVEIIKGVDLEIGDGEFLVLVGPSGCGKSTLLRLIAGLEDITGGELSIGDRVVNDVAPRDRGVGMVFQSYALYPHMTVRENMAFGLKIRKVERKIIDERVNEAAALLDLEPYLDRFPKQLSGGQRQRVAMGRAIVRQPRVFLFDEPLSNLDAALRTQMRVELKKLHRRLEATMIYVTHDQVEAMTLADRITILNKGLVQQVGTPDEVYNTPANEFVASFIGSPAMNFFDGEIHGASFQGDSCTFPLGEAQKKAARVGVRPQHLDILSEDQEIPEGWGKVEAEVDVIEPMGWEAYLHLKRGEYTMVAHVETESLGEISAGDRLTLVVEPNKIHAFDADGARLG